MLSFTTDPGCYTTADDLCSRRMTFVDLHKSGQASPCESMTCADEFGTVHVSATGQSVLGGHHRISVFGLAG